MPRNQIRTRTLTFLMFTDYGMPVTFHDDHFNMLLGQDYLFARKISPEAEALKLRLGGLWAAKGRQFPITANGREIIRFLVGQGRAGRRYGPRFWEVDASMGRDHVLMMIVAKKWHIAKRLTQALRDQAGIPAVDYLFNELEANLPDLGGVETTLAKRARHRRALIRLLINEFGQQKLAICVDPAEIGLINDLVTDRAETRILLVESDLDEGYIRGHMQRIGLTGPGTPEETVERISRSVRAELEHEASRIRDFPGLHIMSQNIEPERNTAVLAEFLAIPPEAAEGLVDLATLFDD